MLGVNIATFNPFLHALNNVDNAILLGQLRTEYGFFTFSLSSLATLNFIFLSIQI